MSDTMSRITLARRPKGAPVPEDFELETGPLPAPKVGEVLIEVGACGMNQLVQKHIVEEPVGGRPDRPPRADRCQFRRTVARHAVVGDFQRLFPSPRHDLQVRSRHGPSLTAHLAGHHRRHGNAQIKAVHLAIPDHAAPARHGDLFDRHQPRGLQAVHQRIAARQLQIHAAHGHRDRAGRECRRSRSGQIRAPDRQLQFVQRDIAQFRRRCAHVRRVHGHQIGQDLETAGQIRDHRDRIARETARRVRHRPEDGQDFRPEQQQRRDRQRRRIPTDETGRPTWAIARPRQHRSRAVAPAAQRGPIIKKKTYILCLCDGGKIPRQGKEKIRAQLDERSPGGNPSYLGPCRKLPQDNPQIYPQGAIQPRLVFTRTPHYLVSPSRQTPTCWVLAQQTTQAHLHHKGPDREQQQCR